MLGAADNQIFYFHLPHRASLSLPAPPLRTYLVSQCSAHYALHVHTSLAVCPAALALQLGGANIESIPLGHNEHLPVSSAAQSQKLKSDFVRTADKLKK